jgi:hypothetical protein
MADTGVVLPGSGSDVSGIGTIVWADPGYITVDDTNYATAASPASAGTFYSEYLRGYSHGFSVPSNATINGIVAKFWRKGGSGTTYDNVVSLSKNGTSAIGDNKAKATSWSLTIWGTQTYGSSSDLWGTTWTPSEINSANFGLFVSVRIVNAMARSNNCFVDYFSIQVYYTLPSTNNANFLPFLMPGRR